MTMSWVATRGFVRQLRERGERYVLGVPCTTTIRDLEAPLPAYQGRGRRPKAPWHSVSAWRHALDPDGWTRLTVRDGEKGPVEIEMVTRRVQTRLERKRTGPHEWLVVTRRPLADKGAFAGEIIAGCRRSGCPLWVSLLSDPDRCGQGRHGGYLFNKMGRN